MVIEVKPIEEDYEILATRVFLKTLDIIGGLKKLVEYRTLTWLPSLARSAMVVVLREEFFKTDEEIAEEVGLTKQTVKNILRADPEAALQKLQSIDQFTEEERKSVPVHLAGGLAKRAYELIKYKGEEPQIALLYTSQTAQALEVPWAYAVLKALKGTDFPVTSPESLKEKLAGIVVKDRPMEEVIARISYPVANPAELLRKIREALEQ